ncbi:MAG: polyhydroxyalkanoate synthesis regulator DNA-binding domain-containing protein [Gammaproteobacteria bacterium]|nr:polyhydroxyalkanoate synthesis regulator DNA-binding domain-containing protein [Gammaproteobacteria bacterium]
MSEQRLIRKYVNRRLYDTTQSRYVNLDDLRELILKGSQVKIVEQATGADITTPVLLQIIADGQRGGVPLLSADFLAGMIRLGAADRDPELAGRLDRALKGALAGPSRPMGVSGIPNSVTAASAAG